MLRNIFLKHLNTLSENGDPYTYFTSVFVFRRDQVINPSPANLINDEMIYH